MNFPGTSLQFRLVPCFQGKRGKIQHTKYDRRDAKLSRHLPLKSPFLYCLVGHLVSLLFIGCTNIPVWRRWSITGFCSYWPPSSVPAPVPKQQLHSSIWCLTMCSTFPATLSAALWPVLSAWPHSMMLLSQIYRTKLLIVWPVFLFVYGRRCLFVFLTHRSGQR